MFDDSHDRDSSTNSDNMNQQAHVQLKQEPDADSLLRHSHSYSYSNNNSNTNSNNNSNSNSNSNSNFSSNDSHSKSNSNSNSNANSNSTTQQQQYQNCLEEFLDSLSLNHLSWFEHKNVRQVADVFNVIEACGFDGAFHFFQNTLKLNHSSKNGKDFAQAFVNKCSDSYPNICEMFKKKFIQENSDDQSECSSIIISPQKEVKRIRSHINNLIQESQTLSSGIERLRPKLALSINALGDIQTALQNIETKANTFKQTCETFLDTNAENLELDPENIIQDEQINEQNKWMHVKKIMFLQEEFANISNKEPKKEFGYAEKCIQMRQHIEAIAYWNGDRNGIESSLLNESINSNSNSNNNDKNNKHRRNSIKTSSKSTKKSKAHKKWEHNESDMLMTLGKQLEAQTRTAKQFRKELVKQFNEWAKQNNITERSEGSCYLHYSYMKKKDESEIEKLQQSQDSFDDEHSTSGIANITAPAKKKRRLSTKKAAIVNEDKLMSESPTNDR